MSKKLYFVVHNFSSLATGGVNRVVAETSNELAKDPNFQINILSLASVDSPCYPISNNVKVHSLGMEKHSTTHYSGVFKILWLFFSFLKILPFYMNEKEKSIWNLTSPPLIILFAFFIKGKNKFLNCEHTSPMRKKNNFLKKIFSKFILNLGDTTISLNSVDHEYYQRNGIKSVLIFNGIKFTEQRSTKDKVIIFVGRFAQEKNPLEALNIFYKSDLWKMGYIFKMYGNGLYKSQLEAEIEGLDLKKYVILICNEKDPNVIYKDASCLIMTSKFEGFGMVLVEAMSRGIPCIAYDCPHGPAEIIIDNLNGFLIEKNNQELFVNKLKNIATLSFDRNIIFRSVEKFDISNIILKWKKLIY